MRSFSRRQPTRLGFEQLEERLAMAWAGLPPTLIAVPTAFTAVSLNSQGDAQGSAAIQSTEIDYFRFDARTTGAHRLATTTPSSNLDTVLGVFNSSGQRLAYNDDISASNLDSQLTVNLTAGQRYYFGITNYTGTAGGSYSWLVDGPGPAAADDSYEQNDTFAQAADLGTVTARRSITGLRMADGHDWYRFTMNRAGLGAHYVRATFTHGQGDLDLRLYNSSGALVRTADGVGNIEQVSLQGLAAGTYYIDVYGYRGALNPNYALEINPATGTVPPPPPPTSGNRVLYLNFDGANISRSDLVRYAGSDWYAGSVNSLDSDQNGISVQSFLSTRSDREQVISQIVTMVQADLNPFGITVRRHNGLAVEGQGATTIFLGQATLTDDLMHVACDIDYGNNNRTDIAFVGNENWGSAANTALALADVTLHEAGHTFGLHHVNSGTSPESMGMRYSVSDQNQWLVNTSFMNQTFAGYAPHGTTPQNSYQVMANNFGGSFSAAAAAPRTANVHAEGLEFDLDCGMDHLLAADDDHQEHDVGRDRLAMLWASLDDSRTAGWGGSRAAADRGGEIVARARVGQPLAPARAAWEHAVENLFGRTNDTSDQLLDQLTACLADNSETGEEDLFGSLLGKTVRSPLARG